MQQEREFEKGPSSTRRTTYCSFDHEQSSRKTNRKTRLRKRNWISPCEQRAQRETLWAAERKGLLQRRDYSRGVVAAKRKKKRIKRGEKREAVLVHARWDRREHDNPILIFWKHLEAKNTKIKHEPNPFAWSFLWVAFLQSERLLCLGYHPVFGSNESRYKRKRNRWAETQGEKSATQQLVICINI